MTNLDAIKAKMYPYELPEETLSFLLDEQGLTPLGTYVKDNDRVALLRSVIAGLWQCMPTKKEKDNGSEVQYDIDALNKLIKRYADELGEDGEVKPKNRDITHYW